MKFICSKINECDKPACPHRRSHDDCGHVCSEVAAARCVMDTSKLPVIGRTGTVAIMIPRRRERV